MDSTPRKSIRKAGSPRQRARGHDAYRRLVPGELVELMGLEEVSQLKIGHAVEKNLTMMFSDIRDFTSLTESMTPHDAFGFVNSYLGRMEPVIRKRKGFIDKYLGDGIMAVFPGDPAHALAAAIDMRQKLKTLNRTRLTPERKPIRAGIGINTGMAMVGMVGSNVRMAGTVISDAVNLASRIETLTKDYGVPVLTTENTIYGLKVDHGFVIRFADRIRVKGKNQPQSVYEIMNTDPKELLKAKTRNLSKFEAAVAFYHLKLIDQSEKLFSECLEEAPGDGLSAFYKKRCEDCRQHGRHAGTGELEGSLSWRDEFYVGVGKIDGEHKILLDGMNRLAPLIKAGDARLIDDLLAFLADYAENHFGNEEALMDEHGYPFAVQHKARHRQFSSYFGRIKKEIEGGQDRLLSIFRIQIFLMDWFANHTTGTDRHFARFLNGRGVW